MAKNLSKAQRIEKMRLSWQLAVEGMPQAQIAEQLRISQSQVSRYLSAIARRIAKRLEDDVMIYASLSLQQTDRVLWEALKAFDRSTKPKKKATRRTSPAGKTTADGSPEATTQEVTEREGDPAWLAEVRAAIKLRVELLDRFAPPPTDDQQDVTGTVIGALLEAERRNEAYRTCDVTDAENPTATRVNPAPDGGLLPSS